MRSDEMLPRSTWLTLYNIKQFGFMLHLSHDGVAENPLPIGTFFFFTDFMLFWTPPTKGEVDQKDTSTLHFFVFALVPIVFFVLFHPSHSIDIPTYRQRNGDASLGEEP